MGKLLSELDRQLMVYGTAKRTAAAPAGEASRVCDLRAATVASNIRFSWSYRQCGDYDLNGQVTVSDLTQIAAHFGLTRQDAGWQQAQLADGDNNGEVNIQDIAPIAMNFGGTITGYTLQGRASSNSEFQIISDNITFIPGNISTGLYPEHICTVPSLEAGWQYAVIPYVDAGTERSFGELSNLWLQDNSLAKHWFTRHGNTSRTRICQATGPQRAVTPWSVELTGSSLVQELVADLYGNIYIGTTTGTDLSEMLEPGFMHCISPQGEMNWIMKTNHGIISTPICTRTARIIFGDSGGLIYCIAPDGKEFWRSQMPGGLIAASPLVDNSGNIYLIVQSLSGDGFADSSLFKLLPDGTTDWSRQLSAKAYYEPVFSSTGDVIVITESAEAYVYDDSGSLVLNFALPGDPLNGLSHCNVCCFRGIIVYAREDGQFQFIAEDNSDSSLLDTSESLLTGLAVDYDGSFSFATQASSGSSNELKLYHYTSALNSWSIALSGFLFSGMTLDETGTAYLSTWNGSMTGDGVSCILPDQTVKWFYPLDSFITVGSIIPDDGRLACLAQGEGSTNSGTYYVLGFNEN